MPRQSLFREDATPSLTPTIRPKLLLDVALDVLENRILTEMYCPHQYLMFSSIPID